MDYFRNDFVEKNAEVSKNRAWAIFPLQPRCSMLKGQLSALAHVQHDRDAP